MKDLLKGTLGFGTAPLGNMYRNIPEEKQSQQWMLLGIMVFVTLIQLHCMDLV